MVQQRQDNSGHTREDYEADSAQSLLKRAFKIPMWIKAFIMMM